MSSQEADLQFFRSLPWCKQMLDDPEWTTFQYPGNSGRPGVDSNQIFWKTFNSEDTMLHILSQTRGFKLSSEKVDLDSSAIRMFISLGAGLDGWTNVCHGGVAATILDQAMTIATYFYKTSQNISRPEFTTDLSVKYVRPMRTPGVVVVTARVRKHVGSKYDVESEIRGHDGKLLSSSNATFVLAKASKM